MEIIILIHKKGVTVLARFLKHLFLLSFGGISYLIIELLFRGYSHISMFFLGGLCFLIVGFLNEKNTLEIPFVGQMLLGAVIITALEFVFGCILNLWLHMHVWDYYGMPFNILGQVCLPFMFLWFLLSGVCIVTDDYLRYLFFGEEKPHYYLFKSRS
ncbi:MAG: hypothetical protein HFE51_09765 [Clostridia bacterium]|nr:hypothetical protein [Clostridia bacterium]MCI8980457.1 hypothetical protein [Clostridia bacterium]MCI9086688.1 hypothetical protein [Clostridia bacterium]